MSRILPWTCWVMASCLRFNKNVFRQEKEMHILRTPRCPTAISWHTHQLNGSTSSQPPEDLNSPHLGGGTRSVKMLSTTKLRAHRSPKCMSENETILKLPLLSKVNFFLVDRMPWRMPPRGPRGVAAASSATASRAAIDRATMFDGSLV